MKSKISNGVTFGLFTYCFFTYGVVFWSPHTVPLAYAQEKIRLGISSAALGFLPTIIAEKKGFYAKYGLTSEHVMVSLSVAINALLTDDLDYTVTVDQGVAAAIKGIPVKLVMMTQDKNTFLLLVKPEIKKVGDLRGKNIGISRYGSVSHLITVSVLRNLGMEPGKDVSLLPGGDMQGLLVSLEAGRVDGIVFVPPVDTIGAKRGYKVLLWARDYVSVPQNALIVSDKKLRQSADQVKRVIKGTIEALQFIRNHGEESIEIASDWMKTDMATTRAGFESILPAYSTDGTMTDEALKAAISMALELAKMKMEVSLSVVADRRFLNEAQKELGLK